MGQKEGDTSLVDLHSQATEIERLILENGGELTPEIEQQLTNIDTSIAIKIDGYGYVLDRMKAVEGYWKGQAAKFAAVGKACKNVQDRIKDRLKYVMESRGQKTIEGETVRFTLTDTQGQLEIIDVDALPARYVIETVVKTVDKVAIKEALAAGEDIPGAVLHGGKGLRKTLKGVNRGK